MRFGTTRRIQTSARHLWTQPDVVREQQRLDYAWAKTASARELIGSWEAYSPSQQFTQRTMQEYIDARLAVLGASGCESSRRVFSSLLTYPLTVAHGLRTLCAYPKTDAHIVIVGARAEASLPISWWRELLYTAPLARNVSVTMVGPAQRAGLLVQSETWTDADGASRSISVETGSHLTLLHESPKALSLARSADLFVLFHPGMGNPQHRDQWMPTLDLLFQTRKPVLCTAFSSTDLDADLHALRVASQTADAESQQLGEALEFPLPVGVNPFSSSQPSAPADEVILTNRFAFAFQAK